MKYYECKSKVPSKSGNSISVRSNRDVHKRNLKCIILGHLNINSETSLTYLLTKLKETLILWSYLKQN